MARYRGGPHDGEPVPIGNYDQIEGPVPAVDTGRERWGVYERRQYNKDRFWRAFSSQEECEGYITKHQRVYGLID